MIKAKFCNEILIVIFGHLSGTTLCFGSVRIDGRNMVDGTMVISLLVVQTCGLNINKLVLLWYDFFEIVGGYLISIFVHNGFPYVYTCILEVSTLKYNNAITLQYT